VTPIRVDLWATFPINPYRAPEQGGGIGLTGIVAPGDDARHPAGGPMSTSPIVSVEGRIVTTRSGTKYRLGRIKPEFREWMREQGIAWDSREPIKIGKQHPRKKMANG
jgi:hypothetical protein